MWLARSSFTWLSSISGIMVAALVHSACGGDDANTTTGAGGGHGGSTDIGGFMSGPSSSSSSSSSSGSGGMGSLMNGWTQTYGGPGGVFPKDVAIDDAGNIVVVGAFSGTIDFGSGDKTSSGGGTETNVFVAKYDTMGAPMWDRQFGSGPIQSALAVALDAQNDVWLCGFFRGSLNFGGGAITNGDQFSDVYTAKLSADGQSQLFSDSYPNQAGSADECKDLVVDGAGAVWLTGSFASSIDLGGGTLSAAGGAGDRDVFLLQLDASGTHLQSSRYGGTTFDEGRALSSSGSQLALAGIIRDSVDFGSGAVTHDASGQPRGFLAQFAGGTTASSARVFNGAGDNAAVAVRHVGNEVVVAGNFKTSIDLGGAGLTAVGNNDDIFVARFDASANQVWQARFGDMASEQAAALAVDSQQFPWLAGSLNGSFDFATGITLSSAGGYDGLLMRLGPPGNAYAALAFGDTALDDATAVAITPNGDAVVVGSFSGNPDFGGGAVMGSHNQDFFVARYAP